jgi:hypothetical protein
MEVVGISMIHALRAIAESRNTAGGFVRGECAVNSISLGWEKTGFQNREWEGAEIQARAKGR